MSEAFIRESVNYITETEIGKITKFIMDLDNYIVIDTEHIKLIFSKFPSGFSFEVKFLYEDSNPLSFLIYFDSPTQYSKGIFTKITYAEFISGHDDLPKWKIRQIFNQKKQYISHAAKTFMSWNNIPLEEAYKVGITNI